MALLLSTQTEAPIGLPPMSTVEIDLDSNTTRHVLKQEPISITLDGQSIFILATLMALIIHFAQPRVAEAVIVLAPLLLVVWNDYQNFLNLGPGGTPSTFKGYVHIAWLRLWAMRNPYVAEPPDPLMVPKAGLLNHDPLPFRSGPRPWVAGIAPHRQLDQHGCDYIFYSLRRTLENVAATNPEKYGIAISCFEKNGLALFARHPINKTCHGEIVHCHMSDHSMHLSIHPDDSRELLEKAWGQRHPLAWKGWFGSMPVPENFVMVYSPRNEQELRVVCRIIEAAMWYVTGEKTEIDVLLGPKTALTSAT